MGGDRGPEPWFHGSAGASGAATGAAAGSLVSKASQGCDEQFQATLLQLSCSLGAPPETVPESSDLGTLCRSLQVARQLRRICGRGVSSCKSFCHASGVFALYLHSAEESFRKKRCYFFDRSVPCLSAKPGTRWVVALQLL